jgi:pimeloyl-ACP methyl ester carboxylesterase
MILIRSLSTLYRWFILGQFCECMTADSLTDIDAADGQSRNKSERAETSGRLLGPTISATRLAEFSIAARKRLLNRSTVSPLVMDCLGFLGSTLFAFALTAAITQVGYALPVALQSCSVPGVKRSARCGAIEVLENPDRPGSRKLKIHFAVIPATHGHTRPDPIVPLLGGPGESAIDAAEWSVNRLEAMLSDRDLLLVDQRGTGQSGPLRCHFFSPDDPAVSLQNLFSPARVSSCAKDLAKYADLTQYSYQRFADDLEKVRQTLGYGPLNLFAGSYGTRAAQVFVRAYPSSVRTIYLGSIDPIDIAMPLPFARAAQSALDRTFAACEADAKCHSAFPQVRDEFSQIMERLASGRVLVKAPGHEGTVALSQGRVAEWFRSLLYRPSSAARLPWLIDQASKGDWDPIVKGILDDARDADHDLSLGLLLSITCTDDVPFVRRDEAVAATRNTFLGDWRLRQQQAACKLWPHATASASSREPIHTQVPTMFVAGDSDGGTPLWFTEHTAPGFQNRVVVIMSNRGHTEWAPCIGTMYQRFLNQGSVQGLDGSACSHLSRPPFKTE